jgi:putative colanic acid biosynthesis UDP-glucose lipid carrier transferase
MVKSPGGHIRAYESELDIFKRIIDGVLIALSLPLASQLYNQAWDELYTLASISAVVLFYVVGKINNLYASSRYRMLSEEITPLLVTWFSVVAGLLLLGYMLKITESYSRVILGLWFAGTPMILILWRLLLKSTLGYFRGKGYNTRRAVIVGAGETAQRLAGNIREMNWTGLNLLGFISASGQPHGVDVLGDRDALYAMVDKGEVDVVYIALPMDQHRQINRILDVLSDTTVTTFLAPDLDFFGMAQGHWISIGDIPTVSVVESPILGTNAWMKRIEDIVIASLGVIITAPLMLLIAIAIKLDSKGPVFYRQRRYGLYGKEFPVWKFRSMKVTETNQAFRQAQPDDDRITTVGKFIRHTSLDEIPQFFDVLAGHMSIVGPRPHAVAHNEEYRQLIHCYMQRHIIKPGITGLAQIKGFRGETDTNEKMEQRIKYDMEYLNNWSVWLDLKIILLTPIVLFRGDNAY